MADASVQNLAEEERFIAEDLLVEILVRLPVTDIIRSKATCKRWHSLIESSSFVDFHFRRRSQDHRDRLVFSRPHHELKYGTMYSSPAPSDVSNSDLITNRLFDIIYTSIPGEKDKKLEKNSYSTLLGPLNNGIYCLIVTDCEKDYYISVATSHFALFNLDTREWKYTNPFPPELAAHLSGEIAQNSSLVWYGFGNIVNESGIVVDYKVVVIILSVSENGELFLSFVYSLRRGTWEKIAHVIPGTHYNINSDHYKAVSGLVNDKGEVETPRRIRSGMEKCTTLFLNGSWHWLEIFVPTSTKYGDRVLSFDLGEEVFRSMKGPPHDYVKVERETDIDSGLMVLNDHLAAVYMPAVYSLDMKKWCCVGFHVWMMMKYGVEESWTKVYSFDTAFNRIFKTVMGLCYSIVTPTKDDNNVQIHRIFFDDYYTGQLISTDGSQIMEHNFYVETNDMFWNTLGVSKYAETLHSLTLPSIDQLKVSSTEESPSY